MRWSNERGQSIVLLAFALVGLLVFTGLAIDAGVIYVGSVNLARAVDAAVLAGVVELPGESGTARADERAADFLRANGADGESLDSHREFGLMGTYRYAITATQEVELYFMPIVGWDHIWLTDSAMAEVDPSVNIYVNHPGLYGQQGPANLAVFGPNSCTCYGDHVSPVWGGQNLEDGRCVAAGSNPGGVYRFRLDIPVDYESRARALTARWNAGQDTNDVVRVEIWDPDCYNVSTSVPGCGGWIDPCIPEGSGENPFWFVRIDENRGPGCTEGGDSQYWTTTRYSLYYYRLAGGIWWREELASYTIGGQSDTDLLWVSPPGFEFAVPEDIYVLPDGRRVLFMDVQALSGSSENGFDLWAGPRYSDVPSEVNMRNEWIVRHPSWLEYNAGATWFGVGRLTMNSNSAETHVPMALAYIPAVWAGREIVVSAFDFEPWLTRSVTLFLSSSRCDGYQACLDGECNWCVPIDGRDFEDGQWHRVEAILPERGFFGGYLQAWYDATEAHDTFGWEITAPAAPRLVE